MWTNPFIRLFARKLTSVRRTKMLVLFAWKITSVRIVTSLFQSHQWIQTGFTIQKCSIQVKMGNFLPHVTLIFDRWPWKTIRHLFYATAFCIISKPSANSSWSYSPETPNSSENQRFLSRVTLKFDRCSCKNNRAPHLTYFKLCALFHSHRSIQTVVTVRKRQIRVKSAIFCPVWPWNLTDDLEKQ